MAFQEGLVKLTGRIGDISFYKTDGDYMARTCGGASAFRIKNDPAFVRTRELNAEFCRAGKAAKIVRACLRQQIAQIGDKYMTGRLVKEMVRVIRADEINQRGDRNVADGKLPLLEGFEFNEKRKLHELLLVPFITTIDRASGSVAINIDAFVPKDKIVFPDGATHFKLVSVACEIDFDGESSVVASTESNASPLNNERTPIVLHHTITAHSANPLFVALGIVFFQQVNKTLYPLKDKKSHALAFVKVEGRKHKTSGAELRTSCVAARRSKTNINYRTSHLKDCENRISNVAYRIQNIEAMKTQISNFDYG